MMYLEPHKVLENCVYVDISAWNGAAITENGDLYMWGLNIFGQCGVAKSENVHDFVWAPEKVLEMSAWYGWRQSGKTTTESIRNWRTLAGQCIRIL